jgi:putative transcriptional regulator
MDFNQQILIALPDMQDSRFSQAIVLICEHNDEGAMGLVLNNPTEIDTNHVFNQLHLQQPLSNQIVLDGGPLNKNCGFIIHNSNQTYKSSITIQNNLTLTTSNDLLESIANHTFDDKWQFILGYSGWTSNQLEAEISENTWLTCPIDLDLIFNTPKDEQWQKALALIGIHNYQNIGDIGHA